MKRLVLASDNPGKIREFNKLFAPLGIEVVAQGSLGVIPAEEPFETFLEKDKSADTPVAVLERMNALEVMMERNDLLERMIRDGIIAGQQSGNLRFYFFRRGSISPADLVRNAFIFANSKPVFPGIACAVF